MSNGKKVTPQALHAFAMSYAQSCAAQGKGRLYPTVRECSSHFDVPQKSIAEAVEEPLDGDQYLGLIVAHRVGNGISAIKNLADQQVEAY
jgi:hypothetical protein